MRGKKISYFSCDPKTILQMAGFVINDKYVMAGKLYMRISAHADIKENDIREPREFVETAFTCIENGFEMPGRYGNPPGQVWRRDLNLYLSLIEMLGAAAADHNILAIQRNEALKHFLESKTGNARIFVISDPGGDFDKIFYMDSETNLPKVSGRISFLERGEVQNTDIIEGKIINQRSQEYTCKRNE